MRIGKHGATAVDPIEFPFAELRSRDKSHDSRTVARHHGIARFYLIQRHRNPSPREDFRVAGKAATAWRSPKGTSRLTTGGELIAVAIRHPCGHASTIAGKISGFLNGFRRIAADIVEVDIGFVAQCFGIASPVAAIDLWRDRQARCSQFIDQCIHLGVIRA
ncbi:hypothetical protein WL55_35855 [Burkholderia cepacia]|nr:hypothetical protein WL55_35855 [Burkholderia cepacia]